MANDVTPARSRPGTAHQAHRRQVASLACNRCRKPLTTTVFVCACDCMFCNECACNHFGQSAECPNCRQALGETDFMELVVANPSVEASDMKKTAYQNLFTKSSKESQTLTYNDACMRLMRQVDHVRSELKFLMRQLMMDTSRNSSRFTQMGQANAALKQNLTTVQQNASAQRLQYEKHVKELQDRLTARDASMSEMQQKLDEKDHQLMQFRKLHDRRTPTSSRESGGVPRSSPRQQQPQSQRSEGRQQQQRPPPLQGFMMNQQAKERAKQQALGVSLGNGRPVSISTSYLTPIQTTGRPYSTDSANSQLSSVTGGLPSGSGGGNHHINKRRRSGLSPSPAGGPFGSIPGNMSPTTAFTVNRNDNGGFYAPRGAGFGRR